MKQVLLRIGTATLFLSLFTGTLISNIPWAMTAFVSCIMAGLIAEYVQLAFYQFRFCFRLGFFGFYYLLYVLLLIPGEEKIPALWSMILGVYIILGLAFWLFQAQEKHTVLLNMALMLLGFLYMVLPGVFWLRIFYYQKAGVLYLIFWLSLVCVGDILAYTGGKIIGGRKFLPPISPGKTWSGLFCGMGGSALAASGGVYLLDMGPPSYGLWHLGFYIGVFLLGAGGFWLAQTGDLLASLLKRRAGVKDSGCLLPGHGGLLDRLDGLLFTLPLLALFLLIY